MIYTIRNSAEICGDRYRDFLQAMCRFCAVFSLTVRDHSVLLRTETQVDVRLRPFLIQRAMRKAWPGTDLFGGAKALVSTYVFSPASCAVLCAHTRSLFEWLIPLPEDLCLYRENGDVLLATIAHEQDAYFDVSDEEKAAVLAAVPWVTIGAVE